MADRITIKSESQHEAMRKAGALTGETLAYLAGLVKPGISTKELDEAAEAYIRSRGGIPSFLNYDGFPASICTSVNEQIVHGIPSKKQILRDGDIISIDCGVILDGFHGDAARTILVGEVSPEVQQLVRVTKECFFKGFEQAVVGNHISDISRAVEAHANEYGYGIVRELVGHGIGSNMHEAPEVPN
ncbi:MAG: type I methionyl aminopeptidase, partial [Clostridiales bacterium]|nr:type I methionyl aminopeptidase [Clostridiales bacterium]MDY5702169.1 type I methionyl aminopeptidase [Eubacteriales bacterium]